MDMDRVVCRWSAHLDLDEDAESGVIVNDYHWCHGDPVKMNSSDGYSYENNPREWVGMIWCDECNGRFVMDPYVKPCQISKEDVLKQYSELVSDKELDYWLITFAWIKNIVDCRMFDLKAKEKLSFRDIEKLQETKITLGKYDPKTMAELKVEYDFHSELDDPLVREQKFNLSYSVESNNAFGPKTPFPKGANLHHDGQTVLLRCVSSIDEEFDYTFDGD